MEEFIGQSGIQIPVLSILTPIPGTPLYESMKDRITIHDLDYYTFTNAVIPTRMPEKAFYGAYFGPRPAASRQNALTENGGTRGSIHQRCGRFPAQRPRRQRPYRSDRGGRIHRLPSRIKRRVLNNNKIEQRHYAIDPATGALTHTNAQLTAEAIRRLNPYPGFTPEEIQCLCCGTTMPDLLAPGHGLMVHGELGNPPCEVISTAGICLSGIAALKYAYMNVALELSDNAVATGSELASSLIRSNFFEHLERRLGAGTPSRSCRSSPSSCAG